MPRSIGAARSSRLRAALDWLVQSRTDPAIESALVKTSTALESLLVIGREPPTRVLQERSAYVLSDEPSMRQELGKAAGRFYGLRGTIVHGKNPNKTPEVEGALEFGDRLVVLLALVLARQARTWSSASDVQNFCDQARWGHWAPCVRPWPQTHLRSMLARFREV